MPASYLPLDGSLVKEEVPQSARCNVKVLAVFSFLIGCGVCGALWSGASSEGQMVQKPIEALALPKLRSVKASQPRTPFMQPQAMPVGTIQDKLSQFGITSSPLIDLAVTAVDATQHHNRVRDVSVMANRLDKATKAKMSKVVARVQTEAEGMAGVTGPLGFWDPLGYTAKCTQGKLLFYREVELKHGRLGMLASLGFLVGENFHPLFGGDIDVPSFTAFQATPLETFWPVVVIAIAIPEIYSVFTFRDPATENQVGAQVNWEIRSDHTPGDFGFDPLGLKPTDPAELVEMQNKELNNGRLAMLAIAGMVMQEAVTGGKLF